VGGEAEAEVSRPEETPTSSLFGDALSNKPDQLELVKKCHKVLLNHLPEYLIKISRKPIKAR
jgi:hypothetical protein